MGGFHQTHKPQKKKRKENRSNLYRHGANSLPVSIKARTLALLSTIEVEALRGCEGSQGQDRNLFHIVFPPKSILLGQVKTLHNLIQVP